MEHITELEHLVNNHIYNSKYYIKKIAGVNQINIIHRYDEFLENFFKIQEFRRRFWTEFLTVYKKSGGRRDFYRLYSLGPECRKRISKSYRY